MILDFTKLFPKSCAKQSLKELKINYDDIIDFHRGPLVMGNNKSSNLEDVIVLKNGKEYHFPAIDTGIFILAGISMAKDTLTEFEQTRMSMLGLSEEYITNKKNAAINYLQEINSLYR